MITDIKSEDRLVQKTFADHLRDVLGWESVYAFTDENIGPSGTLGRASEREVVLVRDLRAALKRLNQDIPVPAVEQAFAFPSLLHGIRIQRCSVQNATRLPTSFSLRCSSPSLGP